MEYELTSRITVSAHTTVEADSLEEAIQIAENRDVCAVHVDSTYDHSDTWMVEEIDGLPTRITQEH